MADEPRTILVVDDEATQRQLLGRFVKSRGFLTEEASSAEEALASIRSHAPNMVLLDVRLPGMSGIEALTEIRKITDKLPVLLITAYADLRQAVAAVKSGADDYLAKPVDLYPTFRTSGFDFLRITGPHQFSGRSPLPITPATSGACVEDVSVR